MLFKSSSSSDLQKLHEKAFQLIQFVNLTYNRTQPTSQLTHFNFIPEHLNSKSVMYLKASSIISI